MGQPVSRPQRTTNRILLATATTAILCALFPQRVHAQLCLGRPSSLRPSLTGGATFERVDNGRSFVPRVGANLGRAFTTVGVGWRDAVVGADEDAKLLQGVIGFMLNTSDRASRHWCPVVRLEDQRRPTVRRSGGESTERRRLYELGMSVGQIVAGGGQAGRPLVLDGSIAYHRDKYDGSSAAGVTSEVATGLAASLGLHWVARRWLSAGASVRGILKGGYNGGYVFGLNASLLGP